MPSISAARDVEPLRHIRIEERIVFPIFEARSGVSGGPTVVMGSHDTREERMLYPAIDHLLGDEERAALARRIRDQPPVLPAAAALSLPVAAIR